MKKNNDSLFIKPLLKGRVVTKPEYIEQKLPEFENNPFTEALPPILKESEILEELTVYPIAREKDRLEDRNVRYHMIKRLKNFMQPLPEHFKIQRTISSMIRWGYVVRNPCTPEFFERLQILNKVKEEKVEFGDKRFLEITEKLRSTADGYSIIGISGIGKTTALERCLKIYPQVIHHTEYKGERLTRTQIVWLKIDCPFDGSVKTLCKMFFSAIDQVIGTDYLRKFGNNTNSAATMMIYMTYLANLHGVGLLVIDELQHLLKRDKEVSGEMLNFFVTLINIVGVPLVAAGTFKALQLLSEEFRQGRRVASEGILIWDRMSNDDYWDFFVETMWRFQWLKNETALTDALKKVMYEESQGITAIAVNLFILAQASALYTEEEKLTEELIRNTAKNDLYVVHKIIKAIKDNDIEAIAQYEDIS